MSVEDVVRMKKHSLSDLDKVLDVFVKEKGKKLITEQNRMKLGGWILSM